MSVTRCTLTTVTAENTPLADLIERAQALREQSDADSGELFRTTASLDQAGGEALERGDIDAASNAFAEALLTIRALWKKEPESAVVARFVSVSLGRVGEVALWRGDVEAAYTAHEESVKIDRTVLSVQPEAPQALRDLSASLSQLGGLAYQRGDADTGATAFAEAIELLQQLSQQDGEATDASLRLASLREQVGDVARMRGDWAAAEAEFTQALQLKRDLVEQLPQQIHLRREVPKLLELLGDVARDRGDLEAAEKAHAEALELRRALMAEYPNAPIEVANGSREFPAREVVVSLNRMCDLALAREDLDAAETLINEAFEITHSLIERQQGALEPVRDLSAVLDRRGEVAFLRGDVAAATRDWTDSLTTRRALLKAQPQSLQAMQDLRVALMLMLRVEQDHDKKLELFLELREMVAVLGQHLQTFEAILEWASVDMSLVPIMDDADVPAESRANIYRELVWLLEQLDQAQPLPDNYRVVLDDVRARLAALPESDQG